MNKNNIITGIASLLLTGCLDDPYYNNIQQQCNIPLGQQQIMAQQALTNQYGTLGWDVLEGSPSRYDDLDSILSEIAEIENVHGIYWVLDGGKADGFGAFTMPANTLVFHEDSARMSYAAGMALEYIRVLGLPEDSFRIRMIQDIYNIQFTPLGPAGYDSSVVCCDSRNYALSTLGGIAAHESAHIHNNDAVNRACAMYTNNNPYAIAAFSYEQEKQADITGANFVADAYLQNPNGPLQPLGMILAMEIMEAMESMVGPSPNYPTAAERMANVRQVFVERGIEVPPLVEVNW